MYACIFVTPLTPCSTKLWPDRQSQTDPLLKNTHRSDGPLPSFSSRTRFDRAWLVRCLVLKRCPSRTWVVTTPEGTGEDRWPRRIGAREIAHVRTGMSWRCPVLRRPVTKIYQTKRTQVIEGLKSTPFVKCTCFFQGPNRQNRVMFMKPVGCITFPDGTADLGGFSVPDGWAFQLWGEVAEMMNILGARLWRMIGPWPTDFLNFLLCGICVAKIRTQQLLTNSGFNAQFLSHPTTGLPADPGSKSLTRSKNVSDSKADTQTHFELGFSVNAIVSMGKKAMERQGGKVSLKCIV